MKKQLLLLKNIALTLLLIFTTGLILAQDVIIKKDRTEIRSKVTEILDNSVKYKKWEMPDGPVYSINKAEVFMIIYQNGQREMISNSNADLNNNKAAIITEVKTPVKTDTMISYRYKRVNYSPTRLTAGIQSPLSLGLDDEFRIIRNTINLGFTYFYEFPKEDYITQSQFGAIYLSLYAPLNRLTGSYKNQNKGLFIFGNAGYGGSYQKISYLGESESMSSYGFIWRFGADFFITDGFGITISSFKFKDSKAGIVFKF